jgi:uroporphyrin-3 C-methyltransferase
MSDSPASSDQSPAPDEAAGVRGHNGVHAEIATPLLVPDTSLAARKWILLVLLGVAAAAMVSSALLWQKLGNIQEELARRSQDAGAQAIEARTLARAAQDTTHEMSARLALLEGRLSEVSLQRSQLEELMQSLSRSRDENLVVDIESGLRLAQQQAQLTGSAEPLIAALKSADERLLRAAQPRLNPLQRAIAKDTDRIKAASLTDVPALMLKIDELTRMADELPLANSLISGAAPGSAQASQAPTPASGAEEGGPARAASAPRSPASAANHPQQFDRMALQAWSQRLLAGLREEAHKLLRVSRIDQPEAALLSPEQSFLLRENFKLRLLNARLGLLARQTANTRSDLQAASAWLARYFDPASRKTQTASLLLIQVQSQIKATELPRLDDTMTALATAAAGR